MFLRLSACVMSFSDPGTKTKVLRLCDLAYKEFVGDQISVMFLKNFIGYSSDKGPVMLQHG